MNGARVYSLVCLASEADFPTYRRVFEDAAKSLMFTS